MVFRAKHKLLPALLDAYAEMCAAARSPHGTSRSPLRAAPTSSRGRPRTVVAIQDGSFGGLVGVLGRELVLQGFGVNDHAA
jgi:hypothetical protein